MKNILLKNVGIGLLLLAIFNIVLFLISLPFGFEDSGTGPTLLPAILFAVVMEVIVWLILKFGVKPKSVKEGLGYSLSWAGIVFALIFLITIPNGTTQVFFGRWFNWLVFITMALVPLHPGFIKSEKAENKIALSRGK